MARKTQNQETAQNQKQEFIPVSCDHEIINHHWSKDNKYCFFSLLLHTGNGDLILHGMKLCYNKDGEAFLAAASYKGDNGRYYQHYYIPMDKAMETHIINWLEDN